MDIDGLEGPRVAEMIYRGRVAELQSSQSQKSKEGSSTSTLSGDDEEMRTGAVINIPGKASGTDSIICGYRGSTRAQMLPRGFIRIFTRPSPNLIFKPNIVRARRVKGLLTTRCKNLN